MTEATILHTLVVGGIAFACIYGVVTILRALAQRFVPHLDMDGEDFAFMALCGAVLAAIVFAVVVFLPCIGDWKAEAQPEWRMTRQYKVDDGPCSDNPKWGFEDSLEPDVLQDGTWKLQVWFRHPDEVAQRCKGAYGCAFENVKDPTYSLIIISRPTSWNDRAGLCIVGHEMMHVFGGRHE